MERTTRSMVSLVHTSSNRPAVLGPLERTDGRRDDRISIGAGGGYHMGGEGGVVAAAVLGVKHQSHV